MKSEQKFVVDFDERAIKDQQYKTGTTRIGPVELESVNDKFLVSNARITDEYATFTVQGQTQTGTRVLPDIDYSFEISVRSDGSGTITGHHDGYPSYTVEVDGKTVYQHRHKPGDIGSLLGTGEIDLKTPF